MIIIFSNKEELNAAIMQKELQSFGVDVKLIDVERQDLICRNITGPKESLELKVGQLTLNTEDNNLYINRSPSLSSEHPVALFMQSIEKESILNHRDIESQIFCKLLHDKCLLKLYPSTYIFNRSVKARGKCEKNICCKSFSLIRSTVTRLDCRKFIFSDEANCLIHLQEIIEGDSVKVHYILGEIFYHKFISQRKSLDPRNQGDTIIPFKVSMTIRKTIDNLLNYIKSSMKLKYFDIDLILTKNKIYLLEINTGPAPYYIANKAKDNLMLFTLNKIFKEISEKRVII